MKKKLTTILSLILIICLFPASIVSASPIVSVSPVEKSDNIISSSIEYLEDGSYIVTEIYEDNNNNNNVSLLATSTTKYKTVTGTVTRHAASGESLCALKLTATFSYDGIIVSCTNKSYTKYVYDSSWSVENVTLSQGSTSTTTCFAKVSSNFVKRTLGIMVKSIANSIIFTCDKNGNIS